MLRPASCCHLHVLPHAPLQLLSEQTRKMDGRAGGRSADTACLPPGPPAPRHSTRRGEAAAITLFIFSLFIRDVSTSPLPPPCWRMSVLAAESQLTVPLDGIHHLHVAQLGIGAFLFLASILKHHQVFLRVVDVSKPLSPTAGSAFCGATRLNRVSMGSALSHRLPSVDCIARVLPCHDSCKAKRD